MQKSLTGLKPAYDSDYELFKKITNGSIIKCVVTKPRNILFHRKFFALLNLVFLNQEKYENLEDLLIEIKLKTGHYKEHITTKGIMIYVPKSISFAKMDEYSFDKFYSKVLNILGKLINVNSDELREQVEEFH